MDKGKKINLKNNWLNFKRFFEKDLWEIDQSSLSIAKSFFIKLLKVSFMTIHGFIEEKCLLRASALTYSTLLSIVPILALVFSMAKGFGVQNNLRPIIIEKLTAGMQDVAEKIIGYVDNTDAKALGTVGLLILIFSVINVLGNIEKSFNDIWGVTKHRSIFRRFSDYLSVLLVGPIMVVAATGVTATLSSNAIVQRLMEVGFLEKTINLVFVFMPYISLWIAFTALYIFMPNTKVNFFSALTGGILGGSLWQISQWGYFYFQVGVSKYNAIYGTFASFPIFIVWLYLSWVIVLLGAKISYATQHSDNYQDADIFNLNPSFYLKEVTALLLLKSITNNFYFDTEKKTAQSLFDEFKLPVHFINEILCSLCQIGVLTEVTDMDSNRYYLPSSSPEKMKLSDILLALKNLGTTVEGRVENLPQGASVFELLKKVESSQIEILEKMTLKDFVLKN